ncbi:hypothetical protein [Geminicoccus roseus]|uniref:hypothetical protein n=1 Tax=Geminicoccus roseus TaxID=404900 RepID=UPI00040D27AF|nr:hypothetical protein [Geminicoccus roseus]
MLLGDLIARLDDADVATETLLGMDDLVLLSRIEAAAAQAGLAPGAFAAQAVALFAGQASDEDWVSLIGVMGQTTDPGQACLKKMVEYALRPTQAAHGCGHHHHPS